MRPAGVNPSGAVTQRRALAGAPTFVLEVVISGRHRAQSGPLRILDWAEVEVLGRDGRAIPGAVIEARLPGGEIRRVRADASGVVRFDGVAPGALDVTSVERP